MPSRSPADPASPQPVLSLRSVWALGLLALAATAAAAQPTVEWGGLAYVDYAVVLDSPDADAVGDNAFDYRRVYLTADVTFDDAFSGRARLEANTSSTTAQGRPSPYVKDLWVRWAYAAAGHRATLGVQPPPVFDVVEDVWGYRSLDKTLLDRTGIRDSRDFGLRLDGPLGGSGLRYAAMVANGNGVRGEDDGDAGKRAYGQLSFAPRDSPLRLALNADTGVSEPDGEPRVTTTRATAFVGAETERFRGGVEAIALDESADLGSVATRDGLGLSVFGAVAVAPRTTVVARYDVLEAGAARSGATEHYVLLALAQRLAPTVQLMPNLVVAAPEGVDPEVLGRVTLDVRF